ncbi:hypothetical protein C8R45DRAFT_1080599 [Mycena sanguinolenta]|nr:hypothetical protein C8R45DRAFT_1080599 [Mycena sanguinolenta]
MWCVSTPESNAGPSFKVSVVETLHNETPIERGPASKVRNKRARIHAYEDFSSPRISTVLVLFHEATVCVRASAKIFFESLGSIGSEGTRFQRAFGADEGCMHWRGDGLGLDSYDGMRQAPLAVRVTTEAAGTGHRIVHDRGQAFRFSCVFRWPSLHPYAAESASLRGLLIRSCVWATSFDVSEPSSDRLEASENWDDDFEFHSNKGSTRPTSHADQLEENVDQDNNHEPHAHAPRHRDSHETTENWDDDFAEDDADADASSPSVEAGGPPETHSNSHRDIYPTSIDDDTNAHPSTSSESGFSLPPPPVRDAQHRTPRASKIQRRQQQQRMRAGSGSTARQDQWDSSDDEELGFGEEEDRTVTARSRRTLASLSGREGASTFTNPSGSPPPPVPPLPTLPGGITPASSIGRGAGIGIMIPLASGSGMAPFPFPRSPTASVFSAPDNAPDNASIAYTHTSAGSTTALNRPRATLTKGAKGLAGLPPSPPIHRERERRRLRKKSRPGQGRGGGGAGVVEMREMREMVGMTRRESSEEVETAEEDWDAEDDGAGAGGGANAIYGAGGGVGANNSSTSSAAYHAHPHGGNNVYFHPSTSSTSNANTPYGAQPAGASASASGSHVMLGSASPGGLLSRIGSVKRWAVAGRKKSSSVSVGSVGMGGGFPFFFRLSWRGSTPLSLAVLSRIALRRYWALPLASFTFVVLFLLLINTSVDPELDVIQDITAHANGLANETTPRPPSANSLLRTGSQSSSQSRSDSRSRSRHSYAHPTPAATPITPPRNKAAQAQQRHSQYGSGQDYTPKTPPLTPPEATAPRGWFFRASSGSPAERERERERGNRFRGGGAGGGVGRDGAAGEGGTADLSGGAGAGERPYTPTPHGGREEKPAKEGKEGKTKLVKRRSLGFVQIRRAIRPLNGNAEGDDNATPVANPSNTNPNPTPNASPSKGYGVLGVGRPTGAAVGSVEDLGRQKEKEREGMGFVERNVRRISLVGQRHKRTKSGVSISAVGVSGDEKENDGKAKRGGNEKRSVDGLPPPASPPVDVQLQPPSPPQTVRSSGASTTTMKASAPINIVSPRKDALTTTFSLASSPGSLPGSLSLASPISLASSSSPSLAPYSATSSQSHSSSPSPKPPVSPQSASLGRSAAAHPVVSAAAVASSPLNAAATATMRRNSLGDLKIPARISQAQVGLRRDLGMVREFARNVEELKELQNTYQALVLEVQGILDMHVLHPPPAKEKEEKEVARSSPTFFKRHRSNTSSSNPHSPTIQQTQQQAYKQLASAFYTINSKYRISWECAELLIELGGGGGGTSPPSTSTSAPAMQQSSVGGSDGLKGGKSKRERAITLQDDAKVPPSPAPLTTTASLGTVPSPPIASPPGNLAWRASTGRNDLSQRQLLLLKEMLNPTPGGPDDSFAEDIPEEVVAAVAGSSTTVNREWRWGDAMNSTITLPSEESGVQGANPTKEKKRRSSRMRMSGIRDMLRALTKGGTTPPVPSSTASTESSSDLHAQHMYQHRQVATNGKHQRRRAKTSAGPESVSMRSAHRPLSPFDPPSLKTASPRRPSLASIFRIGKSKTPPASAFADVSMESAQDGFDHEVYPTFSGISGGRESSNSTGDEEEDWDRLEDSASDAEAAASVAPRGGSTIRGRSPYMHTSFLAPAPGRPKTPVRSPSGSRTSVHDLTAGTGAARATRLSNVNEHGDTTSKAESPSRQFSRSRQGGKTGSVRSMPPVSQPDPKLAMTPENIKPLLENAREVHARLSDCIAEIRSLLAARL